MCIGWFSSPVVLHSIYWCWVLSACFLFTYPGQEPSVTVQIYLQVSVIWIFEQNSSSHPSMNFIDRQCEEHTFHLLKLEYWKLETIWKPLGKETFLNSSPWGVILLSVSFQSFPQRNLRLNFSLSRGISDIHKSLCLFVSCKDFWEFSLVLELCIHTHQISSISRWLAITTLFPGI